MLKKIMVAVMVLSLLIDLGLTISSQSKRYWEYGISSEGNPVGAFFLEHSLVYFIIFVLFWLLSLVLMIKWLVHPLNIVFSSGIALGHTVAAASWVILPLTHAYLLQGPVLLLITALFIIIVAALNIFLLRRK